MPRTPRARPVPRLLRALDDVEAEGAVVLVEIGDPDLPDLQREADVAERGHHAAPAAALELARGQRDAVVRHPIRPASGLARPGPVVAVLRLRGSPVGTALQLREEVVRDPL